MRVMLVWAAAAAVCLPVFAAEKVNPAEIIQKFAAKEAEFREARNNYTYRQNVKIQLLDGSGNPTNEKWEEIRRESFLTEMRQRIRDVRQGPDGFLYVLTDEDQGALLRIEPAQ